MATNPARHPFDDEIDDLLVADPEFVTETRRRIAEYRAGNVTMFDHSDAVNRMRGFGVPLDNESGDVVGSPAPS